MGSIGRLLLLAAVICALILAAVGLHRAMRKPGLKPEEAARLARLDGVWRSRGYGWLWAIKAGRLDVYDESGSYCIARPDIRIKLDDLDQGFDLSADGQRLSLPLEDPTYRFAFDRIEALPEACAGTPDATPPAVIDALGHIFSAHYAFFEVRHVDWPALLAAAARKVHRDTSEEELLAVVKDLLSKIDDDHVGLHARIKGRWVECNAGGGEALKEVAEEACRQDVELNDMVERWKQRVWALEIEDELFSETLMTKANGNVKYGLIDNDIGFLAILAMGDFGRGDDGVALDKALDKAMERFKDARAVIVDVTVNEGGEDILARKIAARFAAKRTLVYSKFAGDAPGAAPQAIYLDPARGPRYLGPVYLLTSNVTLSAAEIFTLAMRALPNVTHMGERTRGSLSDELVKRLPNGWRLTLSNEVYLDADGKGWEGSGIPPAILVPVFPQGADPAASHAGAVRAVVKRIR
jgi:carboxyl-terminal processing protease